MVGRNLWQEYTLQDEIVTSERHEPTLVWCYVFYINNKEDRMSEKDKVTLVKIREHLYKLHKKWDEDPNQDGHHKSNEGYVGVFLHYPNWFEADDYLKDSPEVTCEVYSYLFGPHRLHSFSSLEQAWNEVKTWEYFPYEDTPNDK